MNLKQIIKNSGKITIGGLGFVSSFYTMIDLMYFLSDPNYNRKISTSRGKHFYVFLQFTKVFFRFMAFCVLEFIDKYVPIVFIYSATFFISSVRFKRCCEKVWTTRYLQKFLCYWYYGSFASKFC